jgi:hypothetical protein
MQIAATSLYRLEDIFDEGLNVFFLLFHKMTFFVPAFEPSILRI